MPFDLTTWKTQAADRLKQFTRTAAQASSYMIYSTLAAMTLWPVIEAIGKGDVSGAINALMAAGAAAGAGIITQKALDWKGKTDAEIQREASQWIDQAASGDQILRQDLDIILTKLDAVQHAQTNLSDADRAWFVETLREEAQRLGSTITITVVNTGGGSAIAGGVSVKDGDFVGRDKIIYNTYLASIGNPKLSEAEFKRILNDYLAWVRKAYDTARLYGEESWAASKGKPKRGLGEVFVPVTLREFVPPSRREIEEIAKGLGVDAWARQKAYLRAIDQKRGEGDEVRLDQLLTVHDKLAVIGGAGTGKSTLLAWLAAMLAADAPPSFDLPKGKVALVPIIVPFRFFRVYADECKRTTGERVRDPRAGTLAGFIPWWLQRRSALPDASQDFADRLLRGGGCLLMLDGLDEVVSSDMRRSVRQQVEELVSDVYPGNRVIVTAREAGYTDDKVFSDDFRRLDVQPLSEEQIGALVSNWCRQLYPAEIAERTTELMQAIADINARRSGGDVPPLVSTPLMTTMVVSVKWGENDLPRERAKLYEACVKVILQAQYVPDD